MLYQKCHITYRLDKGMRSKVDGCLESGTPDRNDWVTDCEAQNRIYWAIHEITVLLKIMN